jgi:hypothetical protein
VRQPPLDNDRQHRDRDGRRRVEGERVKGTGPGHAEQAGQIGGDQRTERHDPGHRHRHHRVPLRVARPDPAPGQQRDRRQRDHDAAEPEDVEHPLHHGVIAGHFQQVRRAGAAHHPVRVGKQQPDHVASRDKGDRDSH